jgi:Ca2+-binding EF-hand superfamily protein
MEAFRVFDTEGTGSVPTAEMRYYLRTYGITMAEDEV